MANYKETTGSASAYTRCNRVFIENPSEGQKRVTFNEEKVVAIGSDTIKQESGACHLQFVPLEEFDIVNLETLEPTGVKMTHAEIYGLLFSLYISAAKKRDEVQATIEANQALINQLNGNF